MRMTVTLVMQELIKEYQATLKLIRESKSPTKKEDQVIISGMISDLEYAIEWMKKGRRPGLKRGIERRAAYASRN